MLSSDRGRGRAPPPISPQDRLEPMPYTPDHNPQALGSWARRTGFRTPHFSGETPTARDVEMNASSASTNGEAQNRNKKKNKKEEEEEERTPSMSELVPHEDSRSALAPDALLQPPPGRNGSLWPENRAPGGPYSNSQIRPESVKGEYRDFDPDGMSYQSQDVEDVAVPKHTHMKYEIREAPGIASLILHGIQHYISMLGSLVLIPLIIVPAMGGNDEDTANVVSSLLLVTGLTTVLHSFFGSRLPLIQGSSFVYLAPVLTIINAPEFSSISEDRFKKTMRELQGAIIVSSIFQLILGYTGLMSILLRFINPVVVSPTVAAIGLSFFGYAFPIVGTCVEIGIPQIVIIIVFALYLRRISILGHRIFQVYAVPMGLVITWIYAYVLTASGVYTYKGCDWNIPSSNILSDECRRHAYTMRHCRADTSSALGRAAWFRFPYPLQWGPPTFHYKTAAIMVVVSIIASVDSVGTYHASSLLVASRAPTPGIVSRGLGFEGVTSALAGLWGVGSGAVTLTENVHTIAVTKVGSRRVVQLGACVFIFLSVFGKVGAFIASIPQVIVAALLCVMWAMLAALGLSNLRYSETGSSRNVLIVGFSLFLSLSVPAYFQQYGVSANYVATVAPYLQPYMVAQHGPFRTTFVGLNFALNALFSMNMVIAFMVAFILDNTVPGTPQERGVYVWSKASNVRSESDVIEDYGMPFGLRRIFKWAKCVGL